MTIALDCILKEYVDEVKKIYGEYLKEIVLYGSYARGDYRADSDIDIMILVDKSDRDIKEYRHKLSSTTFEFNLERDIDIKPIAKDINQFNKWRENYPFYANIEREGIVLYGAA